MKVNGWRQVFGFTFRQQIKAKSFIIGTVVITLIVAIMAFLADFIPLLLLDKNGGISSIIPDESIPGIQTLYLCNETKYDFDVASWKLPASIAAKNVNTEEASRKEKEFENSGEAAIVTRITADEDGSLAVRSTYPGGENGVPRSDCDMLSYQISDAVKKNYLRIIGVPDSEVETAMSKVSVSMVCAGEVPKSPIKEAVNIIVPMVSSIVLFIFIFSYSQLVAQAVAIEKSSRIVEYLLTSIKPLALIVGKVLAMCTLSLLQFIIIGVGGFMGFVISLPFGIMSRVGDITNTISNAVSGVASQAAAGVGGAAAGMAASEQIDVNGIISELGAAFEHVDGGLFLVMFLSFILGFLFYAGIAGLAGSSISKMEDLAPALQPLSLIGVLGFYLAYFPKITGEDNAFSLLSRYLPISSPFVLPADYIVGNVDFGGAMLAIAILAAFDIMIMILVAKVYESIILHTGNRLKLGDMLKMSKKTAAK